MMSSTQNFLYWSDKLGVGQHLPLSCMYSGEASIPTVCASSTSEPMAVATVSSPEWQVDALLVLFGRVKA